MEIFKSHQTLSSPQTSWFPEFFKYIFLKSFCKNILQFENFTLLTSIRRGPRRPPWPTTVSELTALAHGGSDVVVGYGGGKRRLQCPRRQHEAAEQPPWVTAVACVLPPCATAVSFFNNERKHTFAMVCTVLVP
jgi:hypothetical protein